MTRNIWVGVVVVIVIVAGGWWYLNMSSVPLTSETTQLPTEQSTQQNTNSGTPTASNSASQSVSNSNSDVITITAPNGGETFKIGNTVRVSWQAKNLPPNAAVDLQLATISGGRPVFDEKTGDCTNCAGGTSSIVLAAPSLVNGAGSIDWEVGKKLYPLFTPPGPGSNYVILATVSRPPTDAEVAECRKKYPNGPQCNALVFVIGRDSSDATFSLTN